MYLTRIQAIKMPLRELNFKTFRMAGYARCVWQQKGCSGRYNQAITFTIFPCFIIDTLPPLSETTNPIDLVTPVSAATDE